MRNRGYYKSQTKFDRAAGAKPCDGKLVTDDPQLVVEMLDNSRFLDEKIRNWNLEDGINWILGFNSYVEDKKGTLIQTFKDSHIFKRGQIVLVDFFGHFGTELTYEHPAIVLADTYDGVIIAPISSGCYNDGVDTHVSLRRNVPKLGSVVNNCGIKLEQCRFISKKRIIKSFKRVTDTSKLNEIDNVLMKVLTPVSYKALTDHQDYLLKELTSKNDLLDEKEKEIESLKRKIELLNQELTDDQQDETA